GTTTAAIQGFGKVGGVAAQELYDRGVKIVAVADHTGGVYNANGIDIPDLQRYANENRGGVGGYKGGDSITNEDLLELNVDILVPAAVDGVITSDNADRINARI